MINTLNLISTFLLLSLGYTSVGGLLVPKGYHPPSSQCYYHWVDTSVGGLSDPKGITHLAVSVTITGLIPLLVDN